MLSWQKNNKIQNEWLLLNDITDKFPWLWRQMIAMLRIVGWIAIIFINLWHLKISNLNTFLIFIAVVLNLGPRGHWSDFMLFEVHEPHQGYHERKKIKSHYLTQIAAIAWLEDIAQRNRLETLDKVEKFPAKRWFLSIIQSRARHLWFQIKIIIIFINLIIRFWGKKLHTERLGQS